MKDEPKNIISKIISIITALAVVIWIVSIIVCSHHKKVEKDNAKTEKKFMTERNISKMVLKHKAVTNWDNKIDKKLTNYELIYTADLQNVLIRADSCPILAISSILDVVKQEEDTYLAYFDSSLGNNPRIRFIIKCNTKQYKQINNQPIGKYSSKEYAFIVSVRKVLPPEFSTTDMIYIRSQCVYTVIGDCLDIMLVSD